MALGEKLRNARLNAKLTTAQVATATRMKVHMVEDIEREDFSKIAAPIYGKGFIRLFAEQVGLDPVPLVDEYMARYVNIVPVKLATEQSNVLKPSKKLEALAPHQLSADALPDMPKEQDLFSSSARKEAARPAAEERQVRTDRDFSINRGAEAADFPGRILKAFRKYLITVKEQVKSINDPWKRRNFNMPMVRFVESPVKWLSVILGTLIILILLLSTMSRMFHRVPKESSIPKAQETREQLRLGVEPPAPYVD